MVWCLELIMTITLLAFINKLFGGRYIERGYKTVVLQAFVVVACLMLESMNKSMLLFYYFAEIFLLSIYIRIQYKKQWSLIMFNVLYAMVAVDVARVLIAISTFPIIVVLGVMPDSLVAEAIISIVAFFWAVLIVHFGSRIKVGVWKNISKGARLGKLLICMMIEGVFLYFKYSRYQSDKIIIYQMMLFIVGFGSIILILWILDKKEEEKKMRDLISYSHKTREVIPTVGRALNRLDELSEHMDKSSELIDELKSICIQDVKEQEKEIATFKTFDTTGSTVLDEQLKRYMEEAQEQEFCLDVIVRAPITELLSSGKIERYKLIQILGDLYRNANKAIKKRGDNGRILICFGYNQEDFFEIAIYDNGELFPESILRHLGERGITTDGTGHGIADVFAELKICRGSFYLDQNLEEGNIFSKGIRIVFDDKSHFEVYVR